MIDDSKPKIMETFSLVGTEKQLDKFKASFAIIGWKLTYQGHSGSWLGQPIYNIKIEPENDIILLHQAEKAADLEVQRLEIKNQILIDSLIEIESANKFGDNPFEIARQTLLRIKND